MGFSLIELLNQWPPEGVWVLLVPTCFGSILLFLRLFGVAGLWIYSVVAVIAANIQVLKAVQFAVFEEPVALGTVVMASSFLCTDILAEYYGAAQARRAVWLGFAAYALMTILMILGLGFRPLSSENGWAWAVENHEHMEALFTPAPALLAAGMIAYLCSQFHDVWIYEGLRRLTRGRWLWLRNTASTALSSLLDSVIFSVLAWRVFAVEALPWATVLFTYILGTYGLRLAVAVLDTPIIYAAKACLPTSKRNSIDDLSMVNSKCRKKQS